MDTKKSKKGFTLVELVITLVLVAILAALAGPPFQELIRRNQIRSITDDFMAVFNTGRSEAIKRNRQVVICASTDGANCDVANWDSGWMMFAETVTNNGDIDAGEPIIQVGLALPVGYTLRGTAPNASSVVLNPDGSTTGLGGTFRICSPAADITLARSIVFNIVGRPRQQLGTDVCP